MVAMNNLVEHFHFMGMTLVSLSDTRGSPPSIQDETIKELVAALGFDAEAHSGWVYPFL